MMQRLLRRYPRLCQNVKFQDVDITKVRLRSDVWMARLIEECYDEAMTVCCSKNSASNGKMKTKSKKRKSNGLDLGGMDAFPLVVQRMITRIYSVMEVRQRIVLELLVTLENLVEKEQFSSRNFSEVVVEGNRASIFSRFLSEEYDLQILSLYLHSRDIVQKSLSISLKDIIQCRIWSEEIGSHDKTTNDVRMSKVRQSLIGVPDEEKQVKSIPVKLPPTLAFRSDASFVEAPLLSIESTLLASLCTSMLPESSLTLRLYLVDRIVSASASAYYKGIKKFTESRNDGKQHIKDVQCSDPPTDAFVPISIILSVLIVEWKAIPAAVKDSLGVNGESAQSLKQLNGIYDKNCQMKKEIIVEKKQLEMQLSDADATLLRLDKTKRRLERKWGDGLAQPEELEELKNVRIALTEAKADKTSIEASIHFIVKKLEQLEGKVTLLWETAAAATITDSAAGPESDQSSVASIHGPRSLPGAVWRTEVVRQFIAAIAYNEEAFKATLKEVRSSQQILRGVSESKGLDVVDALTTEELSRDDVKLADEDEFATLMASLEKEARELATVGTAEAYDLGMEPVSVAADRAIRQAQEEKERLARQEQEEREAKDCLIKEKEDERRALIERDMFSLCDVESFELRDDFVRSRLIAEQAAAAKEEEERLLIAAEFLLREKERERLDREVEVARLSQEMKDKWRHIVVVATAELELLISAAVRESGSASLQASIGRFCEDPAPFSEGGGKQDTDSAEVEQWKKRMGARAERARESAAIDVTAIIESGSARALVSARMQLRVMQEEFESGMQSLPMEGLSLNSLHSRLRDVAAAASTEVQESVTSEIDRAVAAAFQRILASEVSSEQARRAVWMEELARQKRLSVIYTLANQTVDASMAAAVDKATAHYLYVRATAEAAEREVLAVLQREQAQVQQAQEQARVEDVAERAVAAAQERIIETTVLESAFREIDFSREQKEKLLEFMERKRQDEEAVERAVAYISDQIIYSTFPVLGIEIAQNVYRAAVEERRALQEEQAALETAIATVCDELTDSVAHLEILSVAQEQLHDPWEALGLDPATWVNADVLEQVEHMHRTAQMKETIRLQSGAMAVLRRELAVRRLRQTWNKRKCDGALQVLWDNRQNNLWRKRRDRLVAECLVAQRALKTQQALTHWKYLMKVERKGKAVVDCMNDRRFIIAFYTWVLVQKKQREKNALILARQTMASIVIQKYARRYSTKFIFIRRKQQIRIVRAFRCIMAKKKVKTVRHKARRVVEATEAVYCLYGDGYRNTKRAWSVWRKYFRLTDGFNKFAYVFMMHQRYKAFTSWKKGSQARTAFRAHNATKIQATVRMWISKYYILDYYRWQRSLKKLQAHVRRKRLSQKFAVVLHVHRCARKIQSNLRGRRVRSNMTAARIRDLHYAASHNNYDRLNYYVEKFPELISELDEMGNTAIHSAAAAAARRTMKLLLRCKMDPNALNLDGFSPLHLIIMSMAVNRDDCCLYMLDHGFDDEQKTPDGKTCLFLACEYGRATICRQLLEYGMDPNIPDDNGTTCLQTACAQGYFAIVKELVDFGVDVNTPGYCGTVPLHDCVATGSVQIPNFLLSHGAYLNVYEPTELQSPLMWACAAGLEEIVRLYLLQGADGHAKDRQGRTAGHHAAISNEITLYDALREADVDFDEQDYAGNTPLHTAVEYGSYEFMHYLLQAMVQPSLQNFEGEQASHIAARNNRVDMLTLLAKYDKHIGRVNRHHQTPLGLAKFHGAREAQKYLEDHFTHVEIEGSRNKDGEIWWDKEIDSTTAGWHVEVNDRMQRSYVNDLTGERRAMPPAVTAAKVQTASGLHEVQMRKNVELVRDSDPLNKHDYSLEYQEMAAETAELIAMHKGATRIAAMLRRRIARKRAQHLRNVKQMKKRLARFFKKWTPSCVRRIMAGRVRLLVKAQARFRGCRMRKHFYGTAEEDAYQEHVNEYTYRWWRRARLHVRLRFWPLWKHYKYKKLALLVTLDRSKPRTIDEWNRIVRKARQPIRTVGMYEEWCFPGFKKVFFYRHTLTGHCDLVKPKKMVSLDNFAWIEANQVRMHGCTARQAALIVQLQAMWRGYKIRSYYTFVERAMTISLNAGEKYMQDPESEGNLYNYMLFCHSTLHDYERARELYIKALQRMEWRGPDIAFVLYAYCIYSFVTHDQDYSDILMLLERARRAEIVRDAMIRKKEGRNASTAAADGTFQYGKVFELAAVGFFRHAAVEHQTGDAWHNYAACRFLVYNDFNSTFDAFLMAFKRDPMNKRLKANFDIMMQHYYGNDKAYLADIVKKRMQKLAQQDADVENMRLDRKKEAKIRAKAANYIKTWFRWRMFREILSIRIQRKRMLKP